MKQRVRAVIIDSGKLALIQRVKGSDTYYVFPGGGVEDGENVSHALHREIKEELGIEISIGDKLFEYHENIPGREQMHTFYICEMIAGEFGTGDGPEYQPGNSYQLEGTHDPVWVPLSELTDIALKPNEVKKLVIEKYS